ncbi:MAG: amino acid adenylation domain-containing protein [Chloroflexota bacterium]
MAHLQALDVRLAADGERLRINAPAGKLSAELRQRIAAQKQTILALLNGADAVAPIPRLGENEPAPLSFAQERLWFMEQWAPGSAVFNLCRATRIHGPLDAAALQSSFNELVRRHEALRTRFIVVDGRPSQCVQPHEEFSLESVDLRSFAGGQQEIEAVRLAREVAQAVFNLADDRLLRVRVLRLADAEHILVFATHHLVADAWSMGILARELWTLYENFCSGQSRPLFEPACRYRDYAAWQRARLKGDALEAEIEYWRERLVGAPPLDLPTDRPRPRLPSFAGAKVPLTLSEALTGRLNELSWREGATLFMTLLATFQLLLGRYSGQEDIVVGAPAADRETRAVDGVVGLFVNTLALRTDLSGAPSFRELLGRVRDVCLGAYTHQAVPFEILVQHLAPQRELNRQPLFQVMFVLQNTPAQLVAPAGLALQPFEIDSAAAQFDLSLYLRERRGRLIGFLEYTTELFDRATVTRIAGHFQTLLEGIVAGPDRSIAALPLLSAAERKQLIAEWNDTAADCPSDACIHELFEAQAARTPERIALECAGEKWTYRELNCRSNHAARELRKLGVKKERLVGVMADRSMETTATLLGILKAGGAYVPLDPAYPKERLEFMLSDSRAAVLIAQEKYAGRVGDFSAKQVSMDQLLRGRSGDATNLMKSARPENAACVIYTSGSSGTPKGVIALHRGALNRFAWMWRRYPFGNDDKSCQKTSLSFIDSVWEMFGALLQGVPTAIVPDSAAKEPALLIAYLSEHGVTRLVAVPSLLEEILNCRAAPHRLPALRYCFSSGEVLPADLARKFRATLPSCRLINLYGSTEVAGDVAYYEVGGDRSPSIPIGRPIDNTQLYLLDGRMVPVPIGVRGELYVGGENLARGYLRRPELTTAKFVANPFGTATRARLYRTGDLARYRADGNVEYLGRVDLQVKIRGCRIEIGEIEIALGRHPDVRECLVASGVEPGNSKLESSLTAYVVPRARRPAAGELRAFLIDRLPEFMLPARFVFLETLPRLPNGKIDRRALPVPVASSARPMLSEPRSELEALVAQVWRLALRVETLGIEDDFFALGGHSLLAGEVAVRLCDALNRPVSARDLFAAPRLADFTAVLEKMFEEGSGKELPSIEPAPGNRGLPLSLGQEPLFLFSQLFGGGDFLNMPYAYRLNGPLDLSALQRALDEIVRRHAVLRAGFRETENGPRSFIRRRLQPKLRLIDLTRLPQLKREAELERISKQDAAQSFDAGEPPLLRVKLVRLAGERHVLLVTMHHLITDQRSMGIFRSELVALYEAFSKDRPSPLPELKIQFADFARWQKESLSAGLFQRQISYWKKRLDGLGPPLDFRGGKNGKKPHYHSSRRPTDIEDGLFSGVKEFAREQNCTPFMVFVTALNVLLHRYTGREDIRIGTLAANRDAPGTEGLIGYFVNALVLRTRVAGNMTFTELLRAVRENCIGAYAHQEVPFEYLETLVERKPKKNSAPLYQVMLNYRNQATTAQQANGLTIASWEGNNRLGDPGIEISRLDVNFHLRELPTKVTGAVNYKTDLFDAAAIARLLKNYSAILAQMVTDCDRPIGDIALL